MLVPPLSAMTELMFKVGMICVTVVPLIWIGPALIVLVPEFEKQRAAADDGDLRRSCCWWP